MGDAEERLVWGTDGGDGRQTPPGQLEVSPGGDEAGAAVSGGACDGEDPRTPPKVVGEEEEEEEELDPRIQVRVDVGRGFSPWVWEGAFPRFPLFF